jgi:hypothetical protein
LGQVRPDHGWRRPSSASDRLTSAQSHGRGSAAQGSMSNGPKASMIQRGVRWACEVPTVFW